MPERLTVFCAIKKYNLIYLFFKISGSNIDKIHHLALSNNILFMVWIPLFLYHRYFSKKTETLRISVVIIYFVIYFALSYEPLPFCFVNKTLISCDLYLNQFPFLITDISFCSIKKLRNFVFTFCVFFLYTILHCTPTVYIWTSNDCLKDNF